MKSRALLLAVVVLLFLPSAASAKSWSFDFWDVDITVRPDSSILVRETQTFNFEGEYHWVTRELITSKGIVYRNIRVYDSEGEVLSGGDVDISNRGTSADIKLNFSLADTMATWTFEYEAWNALGFFDDHDELYWNAVSTERDVPIEQAAVTIHLPPEVPFNSTTQRLLVGAVGGTEESSDYSVTPEGDLVFTSGFIAPNDSLTIVAGWPKGYVTETVVEPERTPLGRFLDILAWFVYASPIVVLFFLIRRWYRVGRDPAARGTVVPQYDPPDASPPAVVGVLFDEKADTRDLSATIVDLAVRGFLTIEETQAGTLFKKTSYRFHRKDNPRGKLAAYEQDLLEALFEEGTSVDLDDLKMKFYKHLKTIHEGMYDESVARGYFSENPSAVRNRYLFAGIGIIFIAVFSFGVFAAQAPRHFMVLPALIIDGLSVLIIGRAMPRKTQKGAHAREWAEGFKMYLHTAERFRVKAMTPGTFERFLPYAMVFGVEKDWARSFAGIYTEPPGWYTGGSWGTFNALAFTTSLSSAMNTTVAHTLASSPSSSSGFGGGGFSGGGGGGGGSGAG